MEKSNLQQNHLARTGKFRVIQEYRNLLDNIDNSFSYNVPFQQESLENYADFENRNGPFHKIKQRNVMMY